jgi:hypothetical protein
MMSALNLTKVEEDSLREFLASRGVSYECLMDQYAGMKDVSAAYIARAILNAIIGGEEK